MNRKLPNTMFRIEHSIQDQLPLNISNCITSQSNAGCGCFGPTHFAADTSNGGGSGRSCEDSICMLECKSTISSNDEASFSTPLINSDSEAAFAKAITYDYMR
ncbi:hypothetical protein Pyn_34950 [Prunus yedoensis var. nudiflora]|uniref:Uncharacterized protein n=1 Tax=Prunus yedoensis var. nudiflora TaxID=2094558 RepID=A0A314V1X3_PRUYE|nr:hypothetical protein Pyn_34950 [Prunus yedoensis var. nudiflora]